MLNLLRELKLQSNSDYPFPYDGSAIYRRIIKLYKSAKIQTRKEGFENLDVHSLRKSAGSFLTYAGTSVFDVKEFLAHSSITTAEKHYLIGSDERLKAVAQTLDNLLIGRFSKSDDQK